ncbi:MAG: hypothetical protein HKO53_12930 [Gemmatimonadetes bacterium]|nr:hypothetical protein [Gemmatimonadota bacterium]
MEESDLGSSEGTSRGRTVAGFGSPLHDRRTAFLIVGFIAIAVYLNSLPNLFAYDDLHIIQNNEAIHSLETLPGALIKPYWTGHYGRELGLWRPVATAMFGIQWILTDGQPLLFHIVNVVMHAVASVLTLLLLLELMPLAAAFAGGLIFAVHPVHVEAVANVIGLSELVSTACVLGACLVHVRGGERSGWSTALLVGLFYALGIGSKESAITLPALILLLDAARRHVDFRELPRYIGDRWRVYGVMLVVSLAMLAGRYAILGSIAAPFAPLGADLLLEIPRIWTLGEIWLHYVRLWVFPLDLSSDYSPGVIPISIQWGVNNTMGAVLAVAVLVLSLVAWRRPFMEPGRDSARTAAFGVVWFIIAISPTSNALFLSGILLAERTLYLPSVGLAAATGWLIVRLARERKRVAWVGLTVIVLLSSVRVWTRNPTWKDTLTVLGTLMEDYPQSGRSQWILGDQFIRQGRPSQGLLSYRAAIDLLGTHYALSTEIARVLMAEGLYDPAEILLKFAVDDQPELPLGYALLALVEAERGNAEAAESYARQSLAIEAADPTRLHLLAWALAAQGRIDEAREARDRAEEMGQALFWQQYMYHAHVRWAEGDTAGALVALDSASAVVISDLGKATLDSVRVAEFGLEATGMEPSGTPEENR